MSTLRFSVSLPDETHSNIEVSVEQVGEPSVGFLILVPDGRGATPTMAGPKPRVIGGKGAATVNDDYALGGYAGI